MEITLFDRVFRLSSDTHWAKFELNKMKETMQALEREIEKPQTLCYTGLDTITFGHVETIMDNFYSFSVVEWLYHHAGIYYTPNDIRGTLLAMSDEDTEWTKWRNEGLSGVCYRKISFKSSVVRMLKDEIHKYLDEIKSLVSLVEEKQEKEQRAKEIAEAEKEAMLDGVKWDVKTVQVRDEGGLTEEYEHTLRVEGETFSFLERNIFDFGRVINPMPQGGLVQSNNGTFTVLSFQNDKGLFPVREMSAKEARAYQIVQKYGMFTRSPIRMEPNRAYPDPER